MVEFIVIIFVRTFLWLPVQVMRLIWCVCVVFFLQIRTSFDNDKVQSVDSRVYHWSDMNSFLVLCTALHFIVFLQIRESFDNDSIRSVTSRVYHWSDMHSLLVLYAALHFVFFFLQIRTLFDNDRIHSINSRVYHWFTGEVMSDILT